MRKSGKRTGRPVKRSLVPVGDVMNDDVVTIDPNATASFARSHMQRRGSDHSIVMEDGELQGIVSERDLGGGTALRSGRVVRDLMTPERVSVGPKATVRDAVNLMFERQIGSLPVFDDHRLVGIVNATDLLDELGRNWARQPFPGWLPKAVKRDAGRSAAVPVPAHIRVLGANLGKPQREQMRRKLGMKLGKFGDSIERVTVRLKDVTGRRGGIDQACTIKVVLRKHPTVLFEARHKSVNAAFAAALTGTERAVRRSLKRSRTKALQGR